MRFQSAKLVEQPFEDCCEDFPTASAGEECGVGLKMRIAGWSRSDPALILAWRGREGGQHDRTRS